MCCLIIIGSKLKQLYLFLQRELTDKEFEKLLEQEEKEKAAKKRKRQEKRSSGGGGGVGIAAGGISLNAGRENSVESGEEVKYC